MGDSEYVKRIKKEFAEPQQQLEAAKEDQDGWRQAERRFRIPPAHSTFRRKFHFRKPD
jgi:hypothetical protein